MAALPGARFLAYRLDMSRSLRAVRLAIGPLTTNFFTSSELADVAGTQHWHPAIRAGSKLSDREEDASLSPDQEGKYPIGRAPDERGR